MAASSGRALQRAPPSMKEIVQKLRTKSSNNLESGLQEIQGLVRKSKGLEIVREFRKLGGLDEVVQVVKSNTGEKLTDLALSVLATCCREQETKTRVDELKGISALVEVLRAQCSVSIINRAARALANLAEIPKLSAAIHCKDVIPLLIKSLKEIPDSNCRQSILRTVRILADTNQHTWEILQSEALCVVLSCLDSDDVKLVACAAHTAAELTNNLGSGQSTEALRSYREAGRQAVEDNGVELLVNHLSHSKPSVQEHALMALLNLMVSEGVRVAAGKAGGVEVFIERSKATTFAGWATYIHCLCFCCREAVNRVRVRNLEGLRVLLDILKSSDEDCVRLHETVLVALMDFYYEEQSLNYLAACGFIQVLVSQLRQEEGTPFIYSAGSSGSRTRRDESTEPGSAGSELSTSSNRSKDDDIPTKPIHSAPRKRSRPSGRDPEKKQSLEAEPKAKRAKFLVTPQSQEKSLQKPQTPVSSPVMTSKAHVAQMTESRDALESTSSLHSSSTSGMSPEALSTNYQSYLNPESTPYSPPSIDWEWFLQHREQTCQELSPRSFSSLSSPSSLSPPRYDFSPLSSPHWSPQWSPQHSPQYMPQWSSPEHGADCSPQQAPQWSPQHSPQWDHQSSLDQSNDPSHSPVRDNESHDSPTQTTMSTSSTGMVAVDETQTKFGVDSVSVSQSDTMLAISTDTSHSAVKSLKSSSRKQNETVKTNKSLKSSSRKQNETVKTNKDNLARESTLQAVCNLSIHDNAELALSRHSAESHNLGKANEPSELQGSHDLALHPEDELPKSSERTSQETGVFREPHTKSLKMRTGKSKMTSVCPNVPHRESLESDSDLLHFIGSKEPKEKSLPSKFERDMEIRRAKEEGKLRKREYAVVTLLSRYSYMDDPSTLMAKESVVSVLLAYQPSSTYLLSKCQRTLHRILRNRLCFEQLLLEHVPMLIARKMIDREKKSKLVSSGHKSTIKRSQSTDDVKSFKSRNLSGGAITQTTEDSSLQLMRRHKRILGQKSQSFMTEPATMSTETAFPTTDRPKKARSLDADTISEFIDDSASDTTSVCSMDALETEQSQLWGDTASPLYPLMVSTCQFRQGVMIGLLLTESFEGKMACVLAVPYICQTNSLKRKLLIKHKGLQILLDFLRKGNIIKELFVKAVRCLCDLSSAVFLNTVLSESIPCPRSPGELVEKISGETKQQTEARSNIRSIRKVASKLMGSRSQGNHQLSTHVDSSAEEEGVIPCSFTRERYFSLHSDAGMQCTSDSVIHTDRPLQTSSEDTGSILNTPEEAMDTLSPVTITNPVESLSDCVSKTGQEHQSDHLGLPYIEAQQGSRSKRYACRYDAMEQQPDVIFLLDQEAVVQAHRDILIKSSEYFSCLLGGPYLESGQRTVPIKEISKEALLLIMHTLYGCHHTHCCYVKDAIASGCNTVLESVACSGRFLLWHIQNQLCDIVVDNYINTSTVVGHFQFGLKHSCSKLSSACLMYMLTSGQVSPTHFQELVERKCADVAFKTIERMITDALFSVS